MLRPWTGFQRILAMGASFQDEGEENRYPESVIQDFFPHRLGAFPGAALYLVYSNQSRPNDFIEPPRTTGLQRNLWDRVYAPQSETSFSIEGLRQPVRMCVRNSRWLKRLKRDAAVCYILNSSFR